MNITKTLKRNCGRTVELTVMMGTEWHSENLPTYRVQVRYKEHRKRTWESPYNHDSFSYRQLGREGRVQYDLACSLTIVSESEIKAACHEIWMKAKPKGDVIGTSQIVYCESCGKAIVQNDRTEKWTHVGIQPRHPAIPPS